MNRRGFLVRAGAASAASILAAPAIVRASSIMRVAPHYQYHPFVVGVDYAAPNAEMVAFLDLIEATRIEVIRAYVLPASIFDYQRVRDDLHRYSMPLLRKGLFS